MANSNRLWRVVGGTVAAGLVLFAFGDVDAEAAKNRRKRGKGKSLTVQRINVANSSGVAANAVIEVIFSTDVDPSTINHAQFRVRAQNATGTGFTIGVSGTFQVNGNIVRFFPRLPTHLRDPASATGRFYAQGSALDNAAENAGLQPSTNYEVSLAGRDELSGLKSKRGRTLRKTVNTTFSTAAAADLSDLYTTTTYEQSPPPEFVFSNPPDATPSVSDQYATRGGVPGVRNDLLVSMFATKVPLSPATVRIAGNVEMQLLSRKGDKAAARPVAGSVFLEQNFDTTLLVFQPRFPLADLGVYGVRVGKGVGDLTETFDMQPNRERDRVRAMYDWLAQARADNPGTPAEQLDAPPIDLIRDWPAASDTVARGILQANILDLGDNDSEEIDPRMQLIFSTRDEDVSDGFFELDFLKFDGLFDGQISTAEWDVSTPGAASAIMTIAGGNASDGDFLPNADQTLNFDTFPGGAANFRDVNIPDGVTVTITGSQPAKLFAINFTLDGTITVNGQDGDDARRGSRDDNLPPDTQRKGGIGGPGGGIGASSGLYYYKSTGGLQTGTNTDGSKYSYGTDKTKAVGGTGGTGIDSNGDPATIDTGGQGGLGGTQATGSTAYKFGGAGGGGGSRVAGEDGRSNTRTGTLTSWNGTGGKGGAGSTNDDLDPLVGGGGGGSGGNSTYTTSFAWTKTGGAGGGGGGALQVQTARSIQIGTSGSIVSRGGDGGGGTTSNSTINAGGGGGGGGGSLLLRSGSDFSIANVGTSFDVVGGAGGTDTGVYTAPKGGDGGDGYLRLESPAGGLLVPGGSSGVFDPIGGGLPSVVYSKFADLGVDGPRLLNPELGDVLDAPENDAILIEIQLTREHPTIFGDPDLSAVGPGQDTLDPVITSDWTPFKVHDKTDNPLGSFVVPGWSKAANGDEFAFDISHLNNKGYRFVRFRVTFQLDDAHTRTDTLPSVDKATMRFQFNF